MPGVVTSCVNMVPSERGMRTLRGVYPGVSPSTDSPTFTGEFIIGHESFERTIYGTCDDYIGSFGKVWYYNSDTASYADVSRTAGYTAAGLGIWSFERFGIVVLGAAGTSDSVNDPIGATLLQAGTITGGQITDIAGAPTCCVVTSAERFVLAFNGQAGNKDSWACSARDNHASWTASPSTLANAGRLVDPPGAIMAAKPMGNFVAVYKADAIIMGRFVQNDNEVWKWERQRHKVGAMSARSVCVLDDGRHAFIGKESCYLFDGTNVVDVLDGKARRWYKANRNPNYTGFKYAALYDSATKNVWFTFDPSGASGLSGIGCIVMNVKTGKLGFCLVPADIMSTMVDPVEPGSRVVGFFDATQHRRWTFGSVFAGNLPHNTGHPGWDTTAHKPTITSADIGHPFNEVGVEELQLDVVDAVGSVSPNVVTLRSRNGRRVASETSTVGQVVGSDAERYTARYMNNWHRVTVEPGFAQELSGIHVAGSGFNGRRK